MKKALAIAFLITAAQLSQAMPPQGGPKCQGDTNEAPSVAQRVEHMSRRLDLTDQQASQITAIFNANEDSKVALMDKLKTIHEEERSQIEAVLTDEQKEQMQQGPGPRRPF